MSSYKQRKILITMMVFFSVTLIAASVKNTPLIVSASDSGRLKVREILVIDALDYEYSSLNIVLWNPIHDWLAVAQYDDGLGLIRIVDPANGEILYTLQSPDAFRGDMVTALAWSTDGNLLIGSYDVSWIHVWDLSNDEPELVQTLEHEGRVKSIALNPVDGRLASASGDIILNTSQPEDTYNVAIWNPLTGEQLIRLDESRGFRVAWSPDGQTLAVRNAEGTIELRDAETYQVVTLLSPRTDPDDTREISTVDFAWRSDSQAIAGIDLDADRDWSKIWVWNLDPDAAPTFFVRDTGLVTSETQFTVVWHPDEHLIASSGGNDMVAYIWDVEAGQRLVALGGFTDLVTSVSWSPDGQKLAVSSRDGTIRIWEIEYESE